MVTTPETKTGKELLIGYMKGASAHAVGYYTGEDCTECGQAIRDETCGTHDYECEASLDNLSYVPECEELEDCEPCTEGPTRFDPLDVEFTVSSRGDLLGLSLLVTFGGPNISLEVRGSYATLKGAWGFDTHRVEMAGDNWGDLLDHYEELYKSISS